MENEIEDFWGYVPKEGGGDWEILYRILPRKMEEKLKQGRPASSRNQILVLVSRDSDTLDQLSGILDEWKKYNFLSGFSAKALMGDVLQAARRGRTALFRAVLDYFIATLWRRARINLGLFTLVFPRPLGVTGFTVGKISWLTIARKGIIMKIHGDPDSFWYGTACRLFCSYLYPDLCPGHNPYELGPKYLPRPAEDPKELKGKGITGLARGSIRPSREGWVFSCPFCEWKTMESFPNVMDAGAVHLLSMHHDEVDRLARGKIYDPEADKELPMTFFFTQPPDMEDMILRGEGIHPKDVAFFLVSNTAWRLRAFFLDLVDLLYDERTSAWKENLVENLRKAKEERRVRMRTFLLLDHFYSMADDSGGSEEGWFTVETGEGSAFVLVVTTKPNKKALDPRRVGPLVLSQLKERSIIGADVELRGVRRWKVLDLG